MLLPWLRPAVRKLASSKRLGRRAQKATRPRLELLETRFAPALLVGPNVNITRFQNNQNEAAIAMDPTNTQHLFEVSNDEFLAAGTGGLLAAFSVDGGTTWTREVLATGTGSLPAACCDAQAIFDLNGNLFVSYLSSAGDTLLLSTDGGQTFKDLQDFSAAADQPKVTVGAGSVWVSFFDGTGISAAGAKVGGLGSVGPFTPVQQLPGSDGGNFGEMAIGPSGQVVVVYTVSIATTSFIPQNTLAPVAIMDNLNPTGVGGTFGPARIITTSNVGPVDQLVAGTTNNFGVDAEPKVVYDNSGGTFTGRLYLVFTDSPTISSVTSDIFEQFSTDDGATWSGRIKINDNTVLDDTFLPSLAIDQSNGNLAIQFFDTRMDQGQGGPNDPSGIALDDFQLWASASFDGGVTWQKNVQVSAGTSSSLRSTGTVTPAIGGTGAFVNPALRPLGPGDYEHSTAFFGGVWYPVWADNSNSTGDNPDGTLLTMDIYTAKVTVVPGTGISGGVSIIPSPSSSGTGTSTTGLISMVPITPPVVDPTGVRASNGANAFATALWGNWSTTANWSAVISGDFTGNGKTDMAGFDQATGQWVVSVSTGSGFTTSVWASWSPAVTWTNLKAGDFTGDGKTDIIGMAGGQWWVGVSTGSSFTTSLWASWSPAVTWSDFQVGNFSGSGKADITARVSQSGQWWTGVSTGSSFSTSLWATWSPAVTWVDVQVGDFSGSGMADITGRVLQSGQWWTGASTGSSFSTSLWATWSPAVTWVDVQVGDFNGDGKADIIGRVLQSGQWWVGQSTGSGFSTGLWATWSPNVTWVNVRVGDFNGTGMDDITGMALQSGQWWTGVSTGSSFNTSLWATWSPRVNWVDVQVGAFNGLDDIMGLDQQSGQWFAGLPAISTGSNTPPPNPTPTNPIGSVPSTNPTPTGPVSSVPTQPTNPTPTPTPSIGPIGSVP